MIVGILVNNHLFEWTGIPEQAIHRGHDDRLELTLIPEATP